jgi:hypothetical protein
MPQIGGLFSKQMTILVFRCDYVYISRSQWRRGLRRRYVNVRLLRLRVRNPPGA